MLWNKLGPKTKSSNHVLFLENGYLYTSVRAATVTGIGRIRIRMTSLRWRLDQFISVYSYTWLKTFFFLSLFIPLSFILFHVLSSSFFSLLSITFYLASRSAAAVVALVVVWILEGTLLWSGETRPRIQSWREYLVTCCGLLQWLAESHKLFYPVSSFLLLVNFYTNSWYVSGDNMSDWFPSSCVMFATYGACIIFLILTIFVRNYLLFCSCNCTEAGRFTINFVDYREVPHPENKREWCELTFVSPFQDASWRRYCCSPMYYQFAMMQKQHLVYTHGTPDVNYRKQVRGSRDHHHNAAKVTAYNHDCSCSRGSCRCLVRFYTGASGNSEKSAIDLTLRHGEARGQVPPNVRFAPPPKMWMATILL